MAFSQLIYGTTRADGSTFSDNDITPQGIITANYGALTDPQYRSKTDTDDSLGAYTGSKDGVVMPNEFFFVPRNNSIGNTMTKTTGVGHTSFNGMDISGISNDYELWDSLQFAGITNGAVYTDRETDMVTDSGVPVQRAGSASVRNIGPDTFAPGDYIKLELPSIHKAKRLLQAQNRTTPQDMKPPPSKLVAIPRRFDPEQDVAGLFRTANTNLIASTSKKSIEYDLPEYLQSLNMKGTNRNMLDQITLRTKEFISLIAFHSIISAVQMGFLELPRMSSGYPSTSQSVYNNLADEIDKINVYKWYEHRRTGYNVNSQGANSQKTYKEDMNDFSIMLAANLGLAYDATRAPWLTDDYRLSAPIYTKILGSASQDQNYFKAHLDLITSSFTSNPGQYAGIISRRTAFDIPNQIKTISLGCANSFARVNGAAYYHVLRQVVGTASQASAPGQRLHMVVGSS